MNKLFQGRNIQAGFTLIEIVVVIALLGILSAVALPRFLDVTEDAQRSKIESLMGTIATANAQIYAKAYLAGGDKLTTLNNTIKLNDEGGDIPIRFGYPAVVPALFDAFDDIYYFSTDDWDFSYDVPGVTSLRISPKGINNFTTAYPITKISRCYLEYTAPTTAGEYYQLTKDVNDCTPE